MTRNDGFNISNNFESLPSHDRVAQFRRRPILYCSMKRSAHGSCFDTDATSGNQATAYPKPECSLVKRKGATVSPKCRSAMETIKPKRLFVTRLEENHTGAFTNLHKRYKIAPASLDRKGLDQAIKIYARMKAHHNVNAIKVCGGTHINSEGQSFCLYNELAKGRKPYTVSNETFKEGWVDNWRPKVTTNYESSRFNTINHGVGEGNSVTKMFLRDEKIFHRLKGIAEYCDLTRVSAVNTNEKYNETLKTSSKCFYKKGETFTNLCNHEKGFGPFFKLFKP
eukprot:TRINITY_DN7779_c0_g1_i3.p1 TRINITY_DN7779_c0_g1~~TRINITY_DN7779_c0_g1_i3.p1  ORF type:complete len:281 (-),score=40.03 TRINITY_DN7779_c0_g1_i3:176-1018(-)